MPAMQYAQKTFHKTYSFGVGEDISFDLEIIKHYNAQVYAFDPTPKSISWLSLQSTPNQFRFFEFGISDFDGQINFNPPENPNHVSCTVLDRPKTIKQAFKVSVYRINSIMKMLNHSKIDILKMDIEGAEYAVLEDIIHLNIPIGQLLVEFHHRFPGIGLRATRSTIQLLLKNGYEIFYRSFNVEEFSFRRTN